jgi:hypothetical protein
VRIVRYLLLVLLLFLTASSPLIACKGNATGPDCCRVCTTGKACGDSCISQSSTCNVGPGCACNG